MKNDLISRQAAIDAINHICPVDTEYDCTLLDRVDVRYVLSDLPSAEPEEVYCPMASRACFANGKEVAWCLTCPHISEEERELVKKAIEPKTGNGRCRPDDWGTVCMWSILQ